MKSLHPLQTLVLGLISLLATNPAMAQEKFNIATGLGHPELINLGLRYQMGQSQLGISAGFFPGEYEDVYSVGGDYYYHFGETSVLSIRRPWYGRLGIYQLRLETDYEKRKYLLLVPRLGKDFNLSPKLGIAADAGLSFVLSREEEGLFEDIGGMSDVILSIGFSLFYRL
ncbi:hypothetical protein FHG64_05645 [Antarcticibacterium flavum]|uniref:Outer membrane protein beta-barrel domain-containing protein n=1 Tax=Antarcticibacterium flavum TaxID=2058175 RepID=A0A5B7X0Q9_9FLAO|nr:MULTISPECIES: hypothetical protein [Antarcticibacterium]MCM4159929.1 hypothetical protein [Antarcticibacterium sp. W02-3]QCY68927.1 hypothetical protein FHG64_05645 [Antarcticibacterium flavum]